VPSDFMGSRRLYGQRRFVGKAGWAGRESVARKQFFTPPHIPPQSGGKPPHSKVRRTDFMCNVSPFSRSFRRLAP